MATTELGGQRRAAWETAGLTARGAALGLDADETWAAFGLAVARGRMVVLDALGFEVGRINAYLARRAWLACSAEEVAARVAAECWRQLQEGAHRPLTPPVFGDRMEV